MISEEEIKRRIERDEQRVARLIAFTRAELADYFVDVRFQFATDMLRLLKPEIDAMKNREAVNGR